MRTSVLFLVFLSTICEAYCSHRIMRHDQNNCSGLKEEKSVTAFLDWISSGTVPLYDVPGGKIQVSLPCSRGNTDDVTMMNIVAVNDSMYQAIAYNGDNDSVLGMGWVYKTAPIRVMGMIYLPGDTLSVFDRPNGQNISLSLTRSQLSNTGMLDVVDVCVDNGWIKIRITAGGNTVEGWIPPNSYCGNPYTTCG